MYGLQVNLGFSLAGMHGDLSDLQDGRYHGEMDIIPIYLNGAAAGNFHSN